MISSESVVEKAAGSVKWSALMEVVSRTASPLSFVILARLLTPEDFGVVSTAMIVITFSQMFWDAGLGKALIQTREALQKSADVVFWTNIGLGSMIYAVLFVAAPALGVFFKSPASVPVLRVLGIQILIGSLTSVQQALFVRDLSFRKLFWIKLITAFIPASFSIPLAFFGYGVWALAAGSLAGSVLNMVLLWTRSAWRPRWSFDRSLARRLFAFGSWIVADSLIGWLWAWGDSLIVGKFLGVSDLGVYRVALTITAIVFGLLLNPFLPVLYPTLARLQDDVPVLRATFHKANRVVMFLALPVGVGLLLVAPMAVSVFLGAKWQALGLVLSVIAFKDGMAWLVATNNELYRAVGRPDVNVKLGLTLLYTIPAYLVGVRFGLNVFAFVRLGVMLVTLPIHIYLCVRTLGVSPWYLLRQGRSIIPATLVMSIVVGVLREILFSPALRSPDMVTLSALIAAGVLTYGAMLWALDRPFVLETARLVKRVALI